MLTLLKQSPVSARIGLFIILVNLSTILLAPYIAPYGETELLGEVWSPISSEHLMGTDQLGRDMFTRVIYGARNTISIALAIVFLSFFVGCTCGLVAATRGGWADQVIGRVVDVIMAFPTLIFALMVLSVMGTSIPTLIVVIAILDSARVFRVSRAVAMDI